MIPIRHVACGTEVTAKRSPTVENVPGSFGLWCPRCQRFVAQGETDARGPLAVSFDD